MTFAPAKRAHVPLLIGIAGPSGSGKTYSALRIAKGIAQGKPIAFIDTERGRALHYADEFEFLHSELDAPFSPERYGQKLDEAVALDPAVIVLDSFSHEWAGEGGVLDMQQVEFELRGGKDSAKFTSWIKPKAAHKSLVNDVLLRLPCHLIVCLRAEEKIDLVKNAQGKLEVVPKRTLAGHVGWIPVCGKELPYELTVSLVVTPDAPGVPHAIKLQEQHKALVPLDRPLDESVGEALAAWAQGSGASSPLPATPSAGPLGAPDQLSDDQKVALDDLVERADLSAADLYKAAAHDRGKTVAALTEELGGGWPALRDSLKAAEAESWIARLEAKVKQEVAA